MLALALKTGLILAVTLLAARWVRRRGAARERTVLAIGAAGALLVPVLALALPAWSIAPAPASVADAATAERALEPVRRAFRSTAGVSTRSPAATVPTPSEADADATRWPANVVGAAWALGFLIVISPLVLAHVRALRLVRSARPVCHPSGARLLVHGALDVPVTVGLLRPRVVLPLGAPSWSSARLEAVLAHENAHVAGRDPLVLALAECVRALHWFDPLAWMLPAWLRRSQERAADDRALASGIRASDYASTLLGFATAALPATRRAALSIGGPQDVGARIERVLDHRRAGTPFGTGALLGIVALAGGGVGLVACAQPHPEPLPRQPDGADAAAHVVVPTARTTPPPAAAGGVDLLDTQVQEIVRREGDRLFAAWSPKSVEILVQEPRSGRTLGHFVRAAATPDAGRPPDFRPGSTLKALTVATALDAGLPADLRIDCGRGAWTVDGVTVRDHRAHGELDLAGILARSSNIGAGKLGLRLGADRLSASFARFGIDRGSPDPLRGRLPAGATWSRGDTAYAACGMIPHTTAQEVSIAYAILANDGVDAFAAVVQGASPASGRRIVSAETARATRALLQRAVHDEHATGRLARVPGTRVAGKTGTAVLTDDAGGRAHYASFVGMLPADEPQFVILVGVEAPQGEQTSGGVVAAPAFARVAQRVLADSVR